MLSHWTQADILVNGIKLHYYRTGHGDQCPLVLVHGFSDNGLCWTPTARDLEADYDVIMPDMRSHGLSARVKPDDEVDMAADLAELIRILELDRPIVGGHSMGAGIAYEIGGRFPELARALVLEDPPWHLSWPDQPPSPDQSEESPIVKWAKSLPGKTMEELLADYHKDHPDWSEEMIHLICESKKQFDPTIADTMMKGRRDTWLDWVAALPTITHPILLFTANPELGSIVTPEVTAKVRELNPNVTIVNVPDVGHLIRYDKYTSFMKALRAFLIGHVPRCWRLSAC